MKGKARVLLCDDEPDFLELISAGLEARGYEVATVSGGREAIDFIKKTPPDILFLDINMPEMNGLETLRQVRRFHKELPIVIISASYQDEKNFSTANQFGISGFFPKTGSLDQLNNIIEASLRAHARLKEWPPREQ